MTYDFESCNFQKVSEVLKIDKTWLKPRLRRKRQNNLLNLD